MYKNLALIISAVNAECPAGAISIDGTCVACPAGTFSYAPGMNDCLTCPDDTFSAIGEKACTLCGDRQKSDAGSSSCGPIFGFWRLSKPSCASGFSTVGRQCRICKTGQYEKNYECLDCPIGQFTSLPGQKKCANCDLGTSTTLLDTATCAPCPAGLFTEAAGSPCESPKSPSDKQTADAEKFVVAVEKQISTVLADFNNLGDKVKSDYTSVVSNFKCTSHANSLSCRFGSAPAKISFPDIASKALTNVQERQAQYVQWVSNVAKNDNSFNSLAELEKLQVESREEEDALLTFVTLHSKADLESFSTSERDTLGEFFKNVDYIQTVQILLAPADAKIILTGIRTALRARQLVWLDVKIADVESDLKAELKKNMHTSILTSLKLTAIEAVNSLYGRLAVLQNTTLHEPVQDLAESVNISLATNTTLKTSKYGKKLSVALATLAGTSVLVYMKADSIRAAATAGLAAASTAVNAARTGIISAANTLGTALSSPMAAYVAVVASLAVATYASISWLDKFKPVWAAQQKKKESAAAIVKNTALNGELAKRTADAAESRVVAILQLFIEQIASKTSVAEVVRMMSENIESLNPDAKITEDNPIALFVQLKQQMSGSLNDSDMQRRYSEFILSCLSVFQTFESYMRINGVEIKISNYERIRDSLVTLGQQQELSSAVRRNSMDLITSLVMLNARLSDYYNPVGRAAIAMSSGVTVSDKFSRMIRKIFSDVSTLAETHVENNPAELFAELKVKKQAIVRN